MELIICELDGTLLTDKKEISDFDLTMINRWRQLGNQFTIVTTRSYKSLYPYAKQLKLNGKAILNSGGVLYDFEKNIPLIVELLDRGAVKKTIKVIDKSHLNVIPIIDKIHSVCVPKNKVHALGCFLTEDELRYTKPISNFKKISYNGIAKLSLVGKQEELRKLKKHVNSYWRFFIYEENCIEIIPRNANLLSYIAAYARNYTKIIAIGKSSRNMAMFKFAHIAVCQHDSSIEVKKNSGLILEKSNNESVVGEYISSLIERPCFE